MIHENPRPGGKEKVLPGTSKLKSRDVAGLIFQLNWRQEILELNIIEISRKINDPDAERKFYIS